MADIAAASLGPNKKAQAYSPLDNPLYLRPEPSTAINLSRLRIEGNDPREVLMRQISDIKDSEINQVAQTIAFARQNEEQLEARADLRNEFMKMLSMFNTNFKTSDLNKLKLAEQSSELQTKGLPVFRIPKSRSGESKFSFVEDIVYFSLKPEYKDVCSNIRNELF